MGYRDAGRKTCQKVLDQGGSLYICTGGESESLATKNGVDAVVLEDRKGFVRLALSYGTPLVPVYVSEVKGFKRANMECSAPRRWHLQLASPHSFTHSGHRQQRALHDAPTVPQVQTDVVQTLPHCDPSVLWQVLFALGEICAKPHRTDPLSLVVYI